MPSSSSRSIKHTKHRRQPSRQRRPAWLFSAGVASLIVGLGCWMFPFRVFRTLVKVGIYPTPAKSSDGTETWAAIGEAFSFMGKIETAGAVLAIAGLIVVGRHYLVVRGDDKPRRQSHDPLDGATYVVEEDGEERIVPPARSRNTHRRAGD